MVRGSVQETFNALLDAEADRLCNAQPYERSAARRDTRAVVEALIEMYLAGVSVRRVEDITEALWGTRIAVDGTGPEQEDLRNDRAVAQPANRKRASLSLIHI